MSGLSSSSTLPEGGISQSFLDSVQHTQDVDEAIFLGLRVAGGQVLLPILLFTVLLSPKVKRHPVFASFCISEIFSSIAFSLLLYKGRSSNDDLSLDPTYNECLVQASLVNGGQAWTVCTTLVVVLHFSITLRAIIKDNVAKTERRGRTWSYYCLMIGGPFSVLLAFTTSSAIIGNQLAIDLSTGQALPYSNLSVPSVFYCVIISNANLTNSIIPGMTLSEAVFYFQVAVTAITVLVEDLVRLLITHRRTITLSKSSQMIIFLRVVSFSAYRTLVFCLSLVRTVNPDELLINGFATSFLYNGTVDFLQAALPLVAFLIFATETDILNVWCFWRYFGGKEKVLVQEAQDEVKKTESEYV